MKLVALTVVACGLAHAHDIITTPITWAREISAIFQKKCVQCHQGKAAFSLTTYKDVRPWAVAIREEVLARTMPPWGAVKGFGEFTNDLSLSPEELELIVQWTEGGVPEGEEGKTLMASPVKKEAVRTKGGLRITGDYRLTRAFRLTGLSPVTVLGEFQMTAELPDGRIEPLLWLKDYQQRYAHSFELRMPLTLPRGTVIRGVPKGSSVWLLPATSSPSVPLK